MMVIATFSLFLQDRTFDIDDPQSMLEAEHIVLR